jgi:hypothetical protein
MQKNLVLVDRLARVSAGLLLFASPVLGLPTYPFNLIGLVLIGTGAVGYCPLYRLLPARHAP